MFFYFKFPNINTKGNGEYESHLTYYKIACFEV